MRKARVLIVIPLTRMAPITRTRRIRLKIDEGSQVLKSKEAARR